MQNTEFITPVNGVVIHQNQKK